MCLNLITKTLNPPDPKVRKGWKYVIKRSDGGLFSIYQHSKYSGDWQTAYGHNIYAYDGQSSSRPKYVAGFHVFQTREDARKAKRILLKSEGTFGRTREVSLAKVEVRDVTYEGTDATTTTRDYLKANIKTLVAKSMRIVEVVKD